MRDPFLDEGVDEQVLQELKQVWTNKLMASKAVEMAPESIDQPTPPPVLANSTKVCFIKTWYLHDLNTFWGIIEKI